MSTPTIKGKAGKAGMNISKHAASVSTSSDAVIPNPGTVRNTIPKAVECWPGTSIVKSLDNAFTQRPESVMATPHETTRAQKQVNAEQARKTQIERCNGFGGNALKGLSKKAREQLANAQRSITIEKAGSGIKRNARTKAAI